MTDLKTLIKQEKLALV